MMIKVLIQRQSASGKDRMNSRVRPIADRQL